MYISHAFKKKWVQLETRKRIRSSSFKGRSFHTLSYDTKMLQV